MTTDSLVLLFAQDVISDLPQTAVTVSLHSLPRCQRLTVTCGKTLITIACVMLCRFSAMLLLCSKDQQWKNQLASFATCSAVQANEPTWVNCKLIVIH